MSMPISWVNPKHSGYIQLFKSLFPVLFGTVVEYYDYALYGFCAGLLATHFFPAQDPDIALLKTFGIFLAGSLSKPLGALIFGFIGDKCGRKIALQISMIGMVVPTTLMGALPTYAQVGWMAPCCLLICRILQGIFTSGESDGVRIFIYETVGQHRPCLANSLSGTACMLGIYLASFAFSQIMHFSTHAHIWRLPFFVGGALGLLVIWGRTRITETPAFSRYSQAIAAQAGPHHFWAVLLRNKRAIMATLLLCGSAGGLYHFYMVFLGNYLTHTLQLANPQDIARCTTQALLIYTLCGPLAGIVADRWGAMRLLKGALFAVGFSACLNIAMIHLGTVYPAIYFFSTICIVFFITPGFVVLLEKFGPGVRYRCLSLGHAMGSMLFSGSTPFMGLCCWHISKWPSAPFVYFYWLILMGFLAIFLIEYDTKPHYLN